MTLDGQVSFDSLLDSAARKAGNRVRAAEDAGADRAARQFKVALMYLESAGRHYKLGRELGEKQAA